MTRAWYYLGKCTVQETETPTASVRAEAYGDGAVYFEATEIQARKVAAKRDYRGEPLEFMARRRAGE